MISRELQHLYWRAGFGATPETIEQHKALTRDQVVDHLFESSKKLSLLELDISEFTNLDKADYKNQMVRRDFQKQSNRKLKDYNLAWLQRMATSKEVLREKMTLFWANHFVVRDRNIVYTQHYYNTLRTHALGNFGAFAKAVSKEAAMMRYLNTKQNRKQTPNENFARELMELFMLGVGQYTEQDIKESARAFTGYNHNDAGEFNLKAKQHDDGEKLFFGKKAAFHGDDIIDRILEQKQCARFICGKIYRYFVNESIDQNHVEELTDLFYVDYNITKLMKYLFKTDWFYGAGNIGTKIKSPTEFLVGMQKVVPMDFKNANDVLKLQQLLGQNLLKPPNVAGWKGGRSWIDSNTMMLRLKLPSILLANAHISIRPKGEFEDSFDQYQTKNKKKLVNVIPNWQSFEELYGPLEISELKNALIMAKLNSGTQDYLKSLAQESKQEACIQLMSIPEYQMC